MELTASAQWINDVFYQLDFSILSFYHSLAESASGILTPVLGTLTLTAWKGAFLILLSLILIVFPKTRRSGICALLAMAFGALITNLLIKNAVARPRPYNFDPVLRQWWEYVGSHMESDLSFPSGHMTATTSFCTGFMLTRGRKWIPWGILYMLLMGISRNYLIVHYPSDVLGGLLIGLCSGTLSFLLIRRFYDRLERPRTKVESTGKS